MADERQQSVQDEQDVSIPVELAQIETFQNAVDEKNLKLVTSVDILQQALHETEASAPVHFSNAETSGLQETTHHLSDHSYIHSSNSVVNMPSCDINSQDADSSDNCLKEGNDSSNLPISSVSLQTTENVTDLNSSQILAPSVFSEETNKICLNGDVLSFSTISNSENIDVFTDPVINSHASTESSLICDNNSIIETPVTENSNQEFIIRNDNPETIATPVLENSNPVFIVRNDNSALVPTPVSGNSNPIFIIRNENPTAVASSLSLPSTSQEVASIKVPVKQTKAPLGSLKNPIQIIQAGNSYHSTQTLTAAQLHQISHVLQKQQAKKSLESRGKSVVYDPSTKTRIVCRIVHPSELQSQTSQNSSLDLVSKELAVPKSSSFRGRGRPRKFQGRKLKEEEKNSSALSKEERDEKKKHRPRTRSGRISKPPSYMVKDYKRIHHLDFNEEPHDDSDGGYSDYQVSGDESEKRASKSNSLPPGIKLNFINCIFCFRTGFKKIS